jgi:hypothetical protein
LDLCATDKNDQVVKQVEALMLPSICLWALSMGKLNEPLIMHLIDKVEFYFLGSIKRVIILFILIKIDGIFQR